MGRWRAGPRLWTGFLPRYGGRIPPGGRRRWRTGRLRLTGGWPHQVARTSAGGRRRWRTGSWLRTGFLPHPAGRTPTVGRGRRQTGPGPRRPHLGRWTTAAADRPPSADLIGTTVSVWGQGPGAGRPLGPGAGLAGRCRCNGDVLCTCNNRAGI